MITSKVICVKENIFSKNTWCNYKRWVFIFEDSAWERFNFISLRASGNTIKLHDPHTITTERHIATDSCNFTDSSFISGEIPSKLALAFVKCASGIGSWTSCLQKFEMFGLSSLVCTVNGIPFYNVSLDK